MTTKVALVLEGQFFKTAFRAMRPHHWLKNLLLLIPFFTAHKVLAPLEFLFAFIAFCLTASAGYLLNDLLDLGDDRQHATKQRRPLANGEISSGVASALSALCLAAGIAISMPLGLSFRVVLLLYFGLSALYSLVLKRMIFFDVVVLATLHIARILAGLFVGGLYPSPWLLIFSFFLFCSLALVKRYAEILSAGTGSRGYKPSDRAIVRVIGVFCGGLSLLIFLFYVRSPMAAALYTKPMILLLTVPALVYWLNRTWHITCSGKMRSDPVLFALTDRFSYLTGIFVTLTMWFAAKGF